VRWLDRPAPDIAEALAAFRHASQWTDDIVGICRRLRGFLAGAPVEAVELDCAEIVDSAMLLIASEANANAITLAKEIEPALTAYADRIQLQQVLTNLLINGIHAIAAANAHGRAPLLTVRARPYNDTQTLFEVIDSGGGIKSLQPDAIFQPLSSTKSDGMGMGLPISKSIVEAHGGSIWVADTGESGTRFCFTLPRSARARSAGVLGADARRGPNENHGSL
jgi:signal transduction histidine kinase